MKTVLFLCKTIHKNCSLRLKLPILDVLAFRNFLQKSFITSSSGPKVVGGNLESHDDYFSHTPDMNRQEWIKRVDGAARSAANEKERKREKTLINRQRVFYWFAWDNKCPIL